MQFPTVTARNLLRRKVELPADFEGEYNVLLIAFQQWQQQLIDAWLPFVKELEHSSEDVRYYELPVIQRLNPLARVFIIEGMRAGITDQLARERTITLYLNKAPFRRALNIPQEDDIYVFLVDRQGVVLWTAQGEYTADKAESLAQVLEGEA